MYSIAKKYQVSKEAIFSLNPDAKEGISPDDKLVVPLTEEKQPEEEAMEFRNHKVKKKETLFSLSRDYNVSIEDIKRYNPQLYAEQLRLGETIRIPMKIQREPEEKEPEKKETRKKEKGGINPLKLSAREHVVLPKETKFGIAQKYNLTVKELDQLNPKIEGLQPGMILKIATKEQQENTKPADKIFRYYQVKPKETLYSLTDRFGISKDSLIVLNPALTDGLKAGMVLKIPNREPVELEDFTEEERMDLADKLSNFDTKNLVVMLPFGLDKIVSSDSISNASERIKKDKVLQISLDFYSGVLMALDSAKALGISSNVQIFDVKQSAAEVKKIINTHNFKNVDAVIGPLLQSTAEAAAAGLQYDSIPVISPLTKRETKNLSNFIQTRPPDALLENAMLSYLSNNVTDKNIIIIADGGASTIKHKLNMLFTGARNVNPKEESFVDLKELTAAMVNGKPNWVILESDNIGILSNATSYLNLLSRKYDITLFTTNHNSSFESDNISNSHLARLHFHFPDVDKEFNHEEPNSFVAHYTEKYGMEPSTYAVRAFDVTFDTLLRLASAESLQKSLETKGTTEYVENKFDYERRLNGGYLNRAVYIMALDDNMELKVMK